MSFWRHVVLLTALTVSFRATADTGCESVLQYASHQFSSTYSHYIGSRYLKSKIDSKSSNDWSFKWVGDGTALSGGQEGSDSVSKSFEQGSNWDNTLVQQVDSVYGPAVDAWLACVNDDPIKARVITLNGDRLTADFFGRPPNGSKEAPKVTVIDAPGMTCTANGQPLALGPMPAGGVPLTSVNWALDCKRAGTYAENRKATTVTVTTDAGTHVPFTIPVRQGPDEIIPQGFTDVAKLVAVSGPGTFGCDFDTVIPGVPWKRNLLFAISTRFDAHSTNATEVIVRVNGTEIFKQKGHIGNGKVNNTEGDKFPPFLSQTLEPYLPTLVQIRVPTGGCQWLEHSAIYAKKNPFDERVAP
jgi:hypothetical protein